MDAGQFNRAMGSRRERFNRIWLSQRRRAVAHQVLRAFDARDYSGVRHSSRFVFDGGWNFSRAVSRYGDVREIDARFARADQIESVAVVKLRLHRCYAYPNDWRHLLPRTQFGSCDFGRFKGMLIDWLWLTLEIEI